MSAISPHPGHGNHMMDHSRTTQGHRFRTEQHPAVLLGFRDGEPRQRRGHAHEADGETGDGQESGVVLVARISLALAFLEHQVAVVP